MKTAFILSALCACALAQGLGGGKPKSCAAQANARVQPSDEQKAAAKQCLIDFAENEGVDVAAAKACVQACPKPERQSGGDKQNAKGGSKGKGKGQGGVKAIAEQYGVTEEMSTCFKKAAAPIVQACAATSGVEMQVKTDRRQKATERVQGLRQNRQGGEGEGASKGQGGKGQKREGATFNIKQIAERVQSCGDEAVVCLKSALGPLGADMNQAVVAFKQAKDDCFGGESKPARVEASAECKADLKKIKETMESVECDLENKLTAEARTCNIPETAIEAMKKLRLQQKASRAGRVNANANASASVGRKRRSVAFLEEFDL